MQRALDAVAPGRYEIINAAAMSYGSHRVLDLLTDVVRMEPDLILVWSGNNEYIERNALPRYARSAGMARLQRVLRHSMLYRALRLGLQMAAPNLFAGAVGEDMTDPRSTSQVRRGMLGRSAEVDRQVADNYRANLREMARLIQDAGAIGVFCTVPVNLAGWMPIDVPPEIADAQKSNVWQAQLAEGVKLWERQDYAAGAAMLEKLLKTTPGYARAHYLLGACYHKLGRYQEALREYEAACDLDPRPVRAVSAFQAAVREVAREEGVDLVDLRQAFLGRSGGNLSGLDLFLDYVHPNDIGHRLAALAVLKQVLPALDRELPMQSLERSVQNDDWISRNKLRQADNFYTLGMTLFNNGDLPGAEQAYLRALQEDSGFADAAGNLAVVYDRLGDLPAAAKYYALTLRLDPGSIHAANYAGLLYRMGNLGAARELGERMLRQGIVEAKLMVMLGYIAFEEGRFADALGLFRQAMAAGEEGAILQRKIGDTLQRLGDDAGARQAYERAATVR
jgi:tetratricopeptide (TPR) repeat protein